MAAGVCSYGFHDLQEAGVIPMTAPLFDITTYIPALVYNGGLYDVLVAIFQFSPSPTALQFFSWLIYLVVVGTLFYFYNRNKKLFLAVKRPQQQAAGAPEKAVANAGSKGEANLSDEAAATVETSNKTKTSVAVD